MNKSEQLNDIIARLKGSKDFAPFRKKLFAVCNALVLRCKNDFRHPLADPRPRATDGGPAACRGGLPC